VSRLLSTFFFLLFWVGVSHAQSLPSVIPAGQVYELAGNASVENLTIDGTLRISRTQASRLEIGCNLIVNAGGVLDMGTDADPVLVDHDLVFDLNNAEASGFVGGGHFQATDCGLWVAGGTLLIHGRDVLRTWGKLNGDLAAGATTVTVEGDVSRWPVGGQVVITQTSFPFHIVNVDGRRTGDGSHYETEVRTIAAVDGSAVTLTAPVSFAHRGAGLERGEVGLLSHNISIRTALESTADLTTSLPARTFAHVMVMHGATAHVQFATFARMGHIGAAGRYALHFHQLGEASRGSVVRGVAFVESGNRATNLHESNGMLVEDTVALLSACAGHYIQTDPLSTLADVSYVHNLVVATQSHSLCGHAPTAFWLGTTDHEQHIGNVAAGFPPDEAATMGFYWATTTAQEPVQFQPGLTAGRVHLKNEAHSLMGAGFKSWQNVGLSSNDDVVGAHAWAIRDSGISHGAYNQPLRWFNARLVENFAGYGGTSIHGYLQDSTILGRGPAASRRTVADAGVQINGYVVQPHPAHPWRIVRTHIGRLTPSQTATIASAIRQSTEPCPDATKERLLLTVVCSPTTLRLSGNTFGADVQPYLFQWNANANAHWTTDGAVFLRRDQRTVPALIPAQLITASTAYDPVIDALVTPLSSLPSTLTWSGLVYNGKAMSDYVLALAYDPPPTVSLSVRRTGAMVQATATVSADTTAVEMWRNGVKVCEQAVCAVNTDTISDPIPAQRFHYWYARAFDGTRIDVGGNAVGVSDPMFTGYPQRAYSNIVEIGPEVDAEPPPTDPTVDELRQQMLVLEQQIQTLAGQNATLTDARNAAQQKATQVGQELSQAIVQIQRLQAAIAAARAALEVP